jgi:hypothetical protein
MPRRKPKTRLMSTSSSKAKGHGLRKRTAPLRPTADAAASSVEVPPSGRAPHTPWGLRRILRLTDIHPEAMERWSAERVFPVPGKTDVTVERSRAYMFLSLSATARRRTFTPSLAVRQPSMTVAVFSSAASSPWRGLAHSSSCRWHRAMAAQSPSRLFAMASPPEGNRGWCIASGEPASPTRDRVYPARTSRRALHRLPSARPQGRQRLRQHGKDHVEWPGKSSLSTKVEGLACRAARVRSPLPCADLAVVGTQCHRTADAELKPERSEGVNAQTDIETA